MTNHVARLYALAASLVVFFAVWLAVSAHPWAQSSAVLPVNAPQTARLVARERHLRAETRRVNLIVERRFAAYRKALARRNHANAAARAQHARQLASARTAAAVARRTVVAQSCGRRSAGGAHRHASTGCLDEDVLTMLRHTFRAMGTDIECLLERPRDAIAERALADAEAEFARLEATLSRFLPDSELSQLNAAGEATVGAELLELAEAALEARGATGGRFDPTVHDALVGAGYDRSFELLASATQAPHSRRWDPAAAICELRRRRAHRSTPLARHARRRGRDWTSVASPRGTRPTASARSSARPARAW